MNNKTISNTESLENMVNGGLPENCKIRASVSDYADMSGGAAGVIGGGAVFLGMMGVAGYYAANFLVSSNPEPYVPGMIMFGLFSIPAGIISYALLGGIGDTLGTAYGVLKNSVIHGPIKTYKALRYPEKNGG
jgi:hypothetical protein